jgi:hypothetical protein
LGLCPRFGLGPLPCLSFFGVVFTDARIAHVRITSGNAVPGADDTRRQDVVMMDDFIYGEPTGIQ